MVTKYLFIEGGRKTKNGDLREGFNILLSKIIAGKMPRIVMGNGKQETIDKFKNNRFLPKNYLLIDLDAPEANREQDLQQNTLRLKRETVFYMIQEMEAWFISQPDILDKFYNSNVSENITKKDPKEFSEPDKELQKLTRATKRGTYHKVLHGVELLKMLDVNKLSVTFPDFNNLIEQLRKT